MKAKYVRCECGTGMRAEMMTKRNRHRSAAKSTKRLVDSGQYRCPKCGERSR